MEGNSLWGELLFLWKIWNIKGKSLYLEREQWNTPKWCRANHSCPQESFSAADRSALIEVPGNWRQSGFWIMYVVPVQHKLCGGLALEQLSCVKSQPAFPKSANLILPTQLQSTLFFCNLDLPSLLEWISMPEIPAYIFPQDWLPCMIYHNWDLT